MKKKIVTAILILIIVVCTFLYFKHEEWAYRGILMLVTFIASAIGVIMYTPN